MFHRSTHIIILWLLAAIGTAAFAEECNCISSQRGSSYRSKTPSARHVVIGTRIGTAGLTYQSDFGTFSPHIHTGLEMSYALLWRGVGIRLGCDFAYAASNYVSTNYTDNYSTIDVERDAMDVYYTIGQLAERHNQWYLGIPLQLTLDFKHVTLNIGPKAVIALSTTYRQTLHQADLRCYYPLYDVEIDNALALATGTNTMTTAGKLVSFPYAWIAIAVDGTYNIKLKNGNKIGIGLYADIAVNNYKLLKTSNLSLLSISDTKSGVPVDRLTESALYSNHAATQTQVVRKFGYFDTGFKLVYYFVRD